MTGEKVPTWIHLFTQQSWPEGIESFDLSNKRCLHFTAPYLLGDSFCGYQDKGGVADCSFPGNRQADGSCFLLFLKLQGPASATDSSDIPAHSPKKATAPHYHS